MAPLQLNTVHQGDWECTTCVTPYNTAKDQPWETVREGAPVCAACIQAQFEKALQFDYEYPPRFGAEELRISDFQSILPAQLSAALMQKAQDLAALDQTPDMSIVEQRTRSQDYQLYPDCTKIIVLGSGCNHLVCRCCQASFCYICGDQAEGDSQHWAIGICPRYGPPGSDMFDRYGPDDELTEEEEAAEERRHMIQWSAFYLDTWSWSVAMQSLDDDALGQDLLRRTLMPGHARYALRRPHYRDILALLRQHSTMHAVSEREWQTLVNGRVGGEQVRELLVDGPQDEVRHHPFLDRGMLTQPVAGAFNMMAQNSRLAAFIWMWDTLRDWDNDIDTDSPQSSAVFDLGPGGDEDMRVRVGRLQGTLRSRRHIDRFEITPMQNAGLLVTIGRPRNIPAQDRIVTPPESFWRLELLHRL
jgi:hypothetical protein